jgi:hypothetical protein
VKHTRSNDRIRQTRAFPVLGRPIPSPSRFPILDDTLLGSAWRWDGDDERNASAR